MKMTNKHNRVLFLIPSSLASLIVIPKIAPKEMAKAPYMFNVEYSVWFLYKFHINKEAPNDNINILSQVIQWNGNK